MSVHQTKMRFIYVYICGEIEVCTICIVRVENEYMYVTEMRIIMEYIVYIIHFY